MFFRQSILIMKIIVSYREMRETIYLIKCLKPFLV